MKFAFVVDPLHTFKIYKDSTYAMLLEADARGHELYVLRQEDLAWKRKRVIGVARQITLRQHPQHWYSLDPATEMPLEQFDGVVMRKDPPFDMEYVTSTWLLELAVQQGARVFNDPRAIRDHSEKLAIAGFPQFIAPTLVSRLPVQIDAFIDEHHDVILKPLDGMGGMGIFRVREDDPNRNVILETITHFGARSIMAQRYLPEIADGDKRILLIAGKPAPYCLARIPKEGESRGNLAAGGTGVCRPLSGRDREIAETLGPELARRGLLLVGLDVIGECLTEINVTSPTCFREITEQSGFNVAGMFLDALESGKPDIDMCPGRRSALLAGLALPAASLFAVAAFAQSQPEIETALELYRFRLLQSGTRLRAYPPEALEQELEGTASVELIIAADGKLRSATLLTSSGHAVLDQGALDLLARAVPLTEIPSTLQNKAFAIRIAIAFRLPVAPSA